MTPRAALGTAAVLAALVLTACNRGSGIDTQATVNAVATGVQGTLEASGTRPPQPSSTAQATLGAEAVTATLAAGDTQPPPPATATAALPTVPAMTFTPAPATPSGLYRVGTPLLPAARPGAAPVVDGDLGEWALALRLDQNAFGGAQWTGVGDASADYALAWDDDRLYLAVRVADDVFVQTERGDTLFRGDSLELLFDADLGADFDSTSLSNDDIQVGLSPGDFASVGADTYLWFPSALKGASTGVTLAARKTAGGYDLEAAIPWSLFNVRPAAGARYGFLLSLNDNDAPGTAAQQSMISSTVGRRLTDPTTWATLELRAP
mgnify:CR=1 FL=1